MTPRLFCAALATALLTLAQAPVATAADLSPQYVQRSTRCPVCGMYPYRTPQWMGQIVFNDQTASTFDSPVDMFRFLNNMIVFDKQHKLVDVGAIWVADYNSKAWVDARKALYVMGSKARGPMNEPNLPAFATRDAADAHIKAQGGKVLQFSEITRELIKSLSGGQHNH
ncbi:nitrous oxide reductase accessory protein NosL [Zoogloea sp.]|uniref:nitrous oxide reductase accessory protein NosL n=1 Tax=Zoogloea sp. TaxID=49181 RepID=UPI001ACF5DF6|nr:nitrous oxide reductase accessory protein NosL [Zoogloea sp.]MBN8282670.1 nitrous oxide reductase accessory protein NosL [Zoogloea sp.]